VRLPLLTLVAAMAVAATSSAVPQAVTVSNDRPVHVVALASVSARSGACNLGDANAVTVVIDYQGLGGGTQQTCVSNLASGATALDALRAAGASVQGTAKDGLSFVCRINSRPGTSEQLTLPNGQSYVESCVNTPPASAYWSYWWAGQGTSWTYSTEGSATRTVTFGEYDGWSFALGAGFGKAPPPRVTPSAWAPAPAPAATAPPAPPPATTSVPQPAPAATHDPAQPPLASQSGSASHTAQTSTTQPSDTDPADTTAPDPSDGVTTPDQDPSFSPSASPLPAQPSGIASPDPAPHADSSAWWGAAIGVGLIVVIAGAATWIWLRKRRGTS